MVIASDSQYIHSKVVAHMSSVSYLATFLYGSNYVRVRKDLWKNFQNIASGSHSEPWIVLGDFNAIRTSQDKDGGTKKWPGYMNDLNDCILDCMLDDLRYKGLFYTWQNNNGDYLIRRKLDRVLVNDQWLMHLPNSEANFLSHCVSDHCLMLVFLGLQFAGGPKPFKLTFG